MNALTVYQVRQGSHIKLATLSLDEAEDLQTSIYADTGKMPEIETLSYTPKDHTKK